MSKKKGLNTKSFIVFNPENDDEFEIFVTFEILSNDLFDEEESFYDINSEIDIKSFEPNNEDDELPEWINEDLVYDSLMEELEIEEGNDTFDDDFEDDFLDEEDDGEEEDDFLDEDKE
jgi:hypothetical protein